MTTRKPVRARQRARERWTHLKDILLAAETAAWAFRLFTATGVAAAATVAIVNTTAGPAYPPIKQAWLTTLPGGYKVERYSVPCLNAPVDLTRPPAGIEHTTEGTWEGALSVFRQHYAPTFQVGRDSTGRVRVVQFCALGNMAAALENHAGGVETNRWARAQIELVGYTRSYPWLPDPGVERALAALYLQLRDSAGIPLRRPFTNGDVCHGRDPNVWGHAAGWYGHCEIPENSHVDPGSLRYSKLFALATSLAPTLNAGAPEQLVSSTPILGKPRTTAVKAAAWATRHHGSPAFVALAKVYWRLSSTRSVRPEVAYVMAAHETAFGRYGGVLNASFHNLCGLKKPAGGGDYDPHAHMRFKSWKQGATACIDHLANIAGARGYPRPNSPDPKQYVSLHGRAQTIETLGGLWAPGAGYGFALKRYLLDLGVRD